MKHEEYVAAYKGILSEEELTRSAHEADEYAAAMKGPGMVPRHLIRHVFAPSDAAKEKLVANDATKADAAGVDYSGIAAKLNYKSFMLMPGGQLKTIRVEQLSNPPVKKTDASMQLFPPGQQDMWPTLVLVSNSNLTSPQAFYDNFQSAKRLVPAVLQEENQSVVVVGSYFSERHFSANAQATLKRCTELGIRDKMEHVTTAAELQAYQILDLLLERNADGSMALARDMNRDQPDTRYVVRENKPNGYIVRDEVNDVMKPVLRDDAAEILQHIVAYGYSAGHNANKDAFRALHDIVSRGAVMTRAFSEDGELCSTSRAMADELIGEARLIGVAGKDQVRAAPRGAPREINFVSRGDVPMAAEGSALFDTPEVEEVKTPRVSRSRNSISLLLGPKPLESRFGGHDQNAYIDALLDPANKAAIGQGWETLSARGRYY